MNPFVMIAGRAHWPAPDGNNRIKLLDTGIVAKKLDESIPGRPYPVKGWSVDADGLARAMNLLRQRYPQANVDFIDHQGIYELGVPHLSACGYAETSLLINQKVAIHPILVLTREFHERNRTGALTLEALDGEIAAAAPGLLADIL